MHFSISLNWEGFLHFHISKQNETEKYIINNNNQLSLYSDHDYNLKAS